MIAQRFGIANMKCTFKFAVQDAIKTPKLKSSNSGRVTDECMYC